ncbi:4'-phosphopantetheinyl transferase superfamily protein [Streptomyces sp. TRM66268-LWL]|uniref:4'-phosphopantetheinyl transferase superfamily protein n=1 Tax=Streptomyces polyasparticus TaxID=2767826 RepID=A0ABR7SDD8_9ACTN|nr:4'-phosphopantetheinyl transferase superfamily protein [Streptomyces polyasparticus]MBC9712994.1 4'-phosphopantetheinyl transferase superfamily protein [Streptomyces polyasparticus]
MIETSRFGVDALPDEPPRVAEVWAVRGPQGYAPLLDADEQRKAEAFRRARDREIYTAAHTAVRVLAGAYLGLDPQEVRVVREDCPGCGGPHGRPALPGAPLHFSLSHTRDLALLAFAPTPVGVDVEPLPAEDLVADVATALHPQEQRELSQLPVSEGPSAFARCWTRKEAYLKGTGEGLAGGGLSRTLVGTGPHPVPVPGWTLADVRAPQGYAAAVAVRD